MKLRIKVTEVTTKSGVKFNAYKVLDKNKKWVDLRFTSDVKDLPIKDGYITVDKVDLNYSTAYLYPRVWVRKYTDFEEIQIITDTNIEELFD